MKITEIKVFQYNIKYMIRKYKSINLKQISDTYRQNVQELIEFIRDRKLFTNKEMKYNNTDVMSKEITIQTIKKINKFTDE